MGGHSPACGHCICGLLQASLFQKMGNPEKSPHTQYNRHALLRSDHLGVQRMAGQAHPRRGRAVSQREDREALDPGPGDSCYDKRPPHIVIRNRFHCSGPTPPQSADICPASGQREFQSTELSPLTWATSGHRGQGDIRRPPRQNRQPGIKVHLRLEGPLSVVSGEPVPAREPERGVSFTALYSVSVGTGEAESGGHVGNVPR